MQFCVSFIARCSVFNSVFILIPNPTYGYISWVITERVIPKHKRQKLDFCEELTVWHFVKKCATVKFVKP